jgi:hypothetical protein
MKPIKDLIAAAKRYWHIPAIIAIAFGIAWHFSYSQMFSSFWVRQFERVQAFFAGTAGDPEQYRILQYLLAAAANMINNTDKWMFWMPQGVALTVTFLAGWYYYKRWMPRPWVALMLATIPIIYAHAKGGYSAGAYIEPGLFMLGLLAIWSRRWWVVLMISFLGTFNRETIALLPLLGIMYADNNRDRAKYLICLAAALIPQGLMRLYWPAGAMTPCRDGMVQGLAMAWKNITDIRGVLFLFGFVGFLPLAWRSLGRKHWPLYVLVGMQLLVHVFVGNMPEVRLLLVSWLVVGVPGVLEGLRR